MPVLNKQRLLERVQNAVLASGWRFQMTHYTHPFQLDVFDQNSRLSIVVYIWNITHGGGMARPASEYRIQLTGVRPPLLRLPGTQTLLLGWAENWNLFAAYDPSRHRRFSTASPSIQFRRQAVDEALTSGMNFFRRTNGEVVVVFRPDLFVAYVQGAVGMHRGSVRTVHRRQSVLRQVAATVEGGEVEPPSDAELEARAAEMSVVTRALRDASFSVRVKGAYGHACAMCGLQFDVLDAAHIVPVSDTPDFSTRNGLCLCPNHHRAFDHRLVLVHPDFRIQVDSDMVTEYSRRHRDGGRDLLLGCLGRHIRVPANPLEQPAPNLLRRRLQECT